MGAVRHHGSGRRQAGRQAQDDELDWPTLIGSDHNDEAVRDMANPRPQAFDPDLAIPLEGEATLEGFASSDGVLTTGTWTHAGGKLVAEFAYDEVCVLLSGHVRLSDHNGYTAEFKAGETFVIPKGFKGTWETLEPVRKHYIIFDNSRINR